MVQRYTALTGGLGIVPSGACPDREVLAALVPERVLPFASGDSRKRGPQAEPRPEGSWKQLWSAERRGVPSPVFRLPRMEAGWEGYVAAPHKRGPDGASFGAPLPSLGGAIGSVVSKTRMRTHRENASSLRGAERRSNPVDR